MSYSQQRGEEQGTKPLEALSQGRGGVIAGAFAGAGASLGITNANHPEDLRGLAGTMSAGVGLGLEVSGQVSQSPNGTFVATISPPPASVGLGLSVSGYATKTKTYTLYNSERFATTSNFSNGNSLK